MKILQILGLRSAETSRGPIWLGPGIAVAFAVAAAILLSKYRPEGDVAAWLWPGDSDSVSTLLQTTATSVITATTIVFSLTLVALQLASQQFSPRLLREFKRDPVTKTVLAILAATFAYCVTMIRQLRGDAPVPALAVSVAYLLALASLGAILAFIAHITRIVRIDTVMSKVHDDTDRAMESFYPPYGDPTVHSPDEIDLEADDGHLVYCEQSGFIRMTNTRKLLKTAVEHDAIIRVEVRPGDFVSRGVPLAVVWKRDRTPVKDSDKFLELMSESVREALVIDVERTFDQDAGFGFRQLADIAVKAISPGINDPVTAATAIAHMGDLLGRLCSFRLGPTLHLDENGEGRVIVPDRDVHYYVETATSQVRRYGSKEPTVLNALLIMLRDMAVACRDDAQRNEVRRARDDVLANIDPSMLERDVHDVRQMARRIDLVLEGKVLEAYADEAGDSRST